MEHKNSLKKFGAVFVADLCEEAEQNKTVHADGLFLVIDLGLEPRTK
jgi:hypothetical protein